MVRAPGAGRVCDMGIETIAFIGALIVAGIVGSLLVRKGRRQGTPTEPIARRPGPR